MNLKDLKRNIRVLNISHKDLDGCASSIIVKNVFEDVEYRYLKYGDVDEAMKTINFNKYDLILLTDISPEYEETFKLTDKILLLDHHDSATRFHEPTKNRFVKEGKCATHLCKTFFEKLFGIDLSYLNDFVNVVNDYDMWILEDGNSWNFNELYFYYYDEKFRNRFKNGDVKLTEDELNYVKDRRKLLGNVYKDINVYNFESVNGAFFVGGTFLNDVCHMVMKDKNVDFSVCINPKSKSCSIRSVHKDFHVGHNLREIIHGSGGHKNAGAFRFVDTQDMQTKLDKLEKHIYENFIDMRI